jgi:hypothetical protein
MDAVIAIGIVAVGALLVMWVTSKKRPWND